MRLTILFLLLSTVSLGQSDTVAVFGEEIMAYTILGYRINKTPDIVLMNHDGVKIKEDSTGYTVTGYGSGNHVTIGYLCNGDTLFPKRYSFRFLNHPDPVIRWRIQDEHSKTIYVHKDSLEQLRDFHVVTPHRDSTRLKWAVLNGKLFMSGMIGAPISFGAANKLPQEFIDTLKTKGDTLGISMTCTIRGIDGIGRLIGASVKVIKLEGEAYRRHIDPRYDYKHFSDTVYIDKQLYGTKDTLHIHNPGHLFLGLPRLKEDYEVDLDDGIEYHFDVPNKVVRAGEGYFIYDAHAAKGFHTLEVYTQELLNAKRIDDDPESPTFGAPLHLHEEKSLFIDITYGSE